MLKDEFDLKQEKTAEFVAWITDRFMYRTDSGTFKIVSKEEIGKLISQLYQSGNILGADQILKDAKRSVVSEVECELSRVSQKSVRISVPALIRIIEQAFQRNCSRSDIIRRKLGIAMKNFLDALSNDPHVSAEKLNFLRRLLEEWINKKDQAPRLEQNTIVLKNDTLWPDEDALCRWIEYCFAFECEKSGISREFVDKFLLEAEFRVNPDSAHILVLPSEGKIEINLRWWQMTAFECGELVISPPSSIFDDFEELGKLVSEFDFDFDFENESDWIEYSGHFRIFDRIYFGTGTYRTYFYTPETEINSAREFFKKKPPIKYLSIYLGYEKEWGSEDILSSRLSLNEFYSGLAQVNVVTRKVILDGVPIDESNVKIFYERFLLRLLNFGGVQKGFSDDELEKLKKEIIKTASEGNILESSRLSDRLSFFEASRKLAEWAANALVKTFKSTHVVTFTIPTPLLRLWEASLEQKNIEDLIWEEE